MDSQEDSPLLNKNNSCFALQDLLSQRSLASLSTSIITTLFLSVSTAKTKSELLYLAILSPATHNDTENTTEYFPCLAFHCQHKGSRCCCCCRTAPYFKTQQVTITSKGGKLEKRPSKEKYLLYLAPSPRSNHWMLMDHNKAKIAVFTSFHLMKIGDESIYQRVYSTSDLFEEVCKMHESKHKRSPGAPLCLSDLKKILEFEIKDSRQIQSESDLNAIFRHYRSQRSPQRSPQRSAQERIPTSRSASSTSSYVIHNHHSSTATPPLEMLASTPSQTNVPTPDSRIIQLEQENKKLKRDHTKLLETHKNMTKEMKKIVENSQELRDANELLQQNLEKERESTQVLQANLRTQQRENDALKVKQSKGGQVLNSKFPLVDDISISLDVFRDNAASFILTASIEDQSVCQRFMTAQYEIYQRVIEEVKKIQQEFAFVLNEDDYDSNIVRKQMRRTFHKLEDRILSIDIDDIVSLINEEAKIHEADEELKEGWSTLLSVCASVVLSEPRLRLEFEGNEEIVEDVSKLERSMIMDRDSGENLRGYVIYPSLMKIGSDTEAIRLKSPGYVIRCYDLNDAAVPFVVLDETQGTPPSKDKIPQFPPPLDPNTDLIRLQSPDSDDSPDEEASATE